jgi:gas vesicle protein
MSHRKTENMLSLLGGALAGAAAMYLLDPEQGRKRREHLKSQTEECLAGTGEVLQSGLGQVTEKVREVGHTLADKAEEYGQRLTQVAHEYGERLAEHAKDARSTLGDKADAVGSRLHDAADNVTDCGNQLWGQLRGLRNKLSSRAEDAIERARSFGEEPASPVMPIAATAVGCAALGVGLMFLMDPQRGQARRKWLMDGVARLVRNTGSSFYRTGKDLADRATGAADDMGRHYATGGPVASEQLQQRVRDELAGLCTQPDLIQVMADANGSITLTGTIPAAEFDKLMSSVEQVDGVVLVINHLDVAAGHDSPEREVRNR